MSKKQLGQFFTTNSDYILQNLDKYVKGKIITDPFAGGGDLLNWARNKKAKKIIGLDIDKNLIDNKNIFYNDSLNNPKKYKFVLTNPPYLNVNKADKITKEKYFNNSDFEDLYQISFSAIMDSEEGIVIVPINFLSAENSLKIRNLFFSKFQIVEMNYFKHRVFTDTTYNVVAFYYKKKIKPDFFEIKTHVFPENKDIYIKLEKKFNWIIGGEFLNEIKKQENYLGVHRLVEKDIENGKGEKKIKAAYTHVKKFVEVKISNDMYEFLNSNILLLKAIDSGTEKGKIAIENINDYNVKCLISKESSRHMVQLVFDKRISVEEQKLMMDLFNKKINQLRQDYLSLFLTNYRDNDRKRISFDFVYKLINHLYLNDILKQKQESLFA